MQQHHTVQTVNGHSQLITRHAAPTLGGTIALSRRGRRMTCVLGLAISPAVSDLER